MRIDGGLRLLPGGKNVILPFELFLRSEYPYGGTEGK